jgi:hypothetical protein
MIATKDIPEQLAQIYIKEENWHLSKMPLEEAIRYHTKLYYQGNIQIYEIEGVVLGYFEVWYINFEQFGRLVAHVPFSGYHENIISGNLAYVANTWIHPDYRKGAVYKILRNRFFKMSNHCTHYCGSALRKKTQPIKVFEVNKLVNKLYKGELNGTA